MGTFIVMLIIIGLGSVLVWLAMPESDIGKKLAAVGSYIAATFLSIAAWLGIGG